MKKFTKAIIIILIMTTTVILYNKFYKTYDIKSKDINLKWNLKYKGINGSKDFAFDRNGNAYIAYKNKIQIINSKGKSYPLFIKKSLNISSVDVYENILFFTSDTSFYSYDLKNNKLQELINNIPNFGDYKNSIIKIKNGLVYISIGAATNSGVVGEDNKWIKDKPFNHDISPYKLTIKGDNFGDKNRTGAFVPYATSNIAGQIITSHFPGNSSIITYNIKNKKAETFAWGIRNVTGMDFSKDGKLYATIGGMENRGSRPIKGDTDYIYKISKNQWYGWPDYSGGDPLNSPKFKSKIPLNFILDKQPTTNPPAPFYQHKKLNAITAMAMDSKGVLGKIDSIYFYDSLDNIVYQVNKDGTTNEKMKMIKNSKIESMKFVNKSLYILDSKNNCMYEVFSNTGQNQHKQFDPKVYYGLTVIILCLITFIIFYKDK